MSKVNKRYFWLKLNKNFFDSIELKRLRKIAGGADYVIIYLKMMLLSIENRGKLYYKGLEDLTFEQEIALAIDEAEDNVKMTVSYLLRNNMMIEVSEEEEDCYRLPEAENCIGSETQSTIRSRNSREKARLEAPENTPGSRVLQCNASATPLQLSCSTEIEKEKRDTEDNNNKNTDPAYKEKRSLMLLMQTMGIAGRTIEEIFEKNPDLTKEDFIQVFNASISKDNPVAYTIGVFKNGYNRQSMDVHRAIRKSADPECPICHGSGYETITGEDGYEGVRRCSCLSYRIGEAGKDGE